MTATDELRRMLDERGARWTACSKAAIDNQTFCRGHTYTEFQAGLMVSDLTPEQAIEATLGRGTCHDEGDPGDFFCSECGVRMFTETNDTYTMIASDERTIIKHPNFCPNCGRRCVG